MRPVWVLAIALLVGMVLVGVGESQDTKKEKVKGQLPAGWKGLKLSQDQIAKIYRLQTDYREKIAELHEKITELKVQEKAEMVKVLTKDQRATLVKLSTGDEPEMHEPTTKKEKKTAP